MNNMAIEDSCVTDTNFDHELRDFCGELAEKLAERVAEKFIGRFLSQHQSDRPANLPETFVNYFTNNFRIHLLNKTQNLLSQEEKADVFVKRKLSDRLKTSVLRPIRNLKLPVRGDRHNPKCHGNKQDTFDTINLINCLRRGRLQLMSLGEDNTTISWKDVYLLLTCEETDTYLELYDQSKSTAQYKINCISLVEARKTTTLETAEKSTSVFFLRSNNGIELTLDAGSSNELQAWVKEIRRFMSPNILRNSVDGFWDDTPKICRDRDSESDSKLNSDVNLWKEPWYHGKLSRQQATSLVTRKGDAWHGAFLVRKSETQDRCFVLTFNCYGRAKHVRLEVQPTGSILVAKHTFPNLAAVFEEFRTSEIPLEDSNCKVLLKYFVCVTSGDEVDIKPLLPLHTNSARRINSDRPLPPLPVEDKTSPSMATSGRLAPQTAISALGSGYQRLFDQVHRQPQSDLPSGSICSSVACAFDEDDGGPGSASQGTDSKAMSSPLLDQSESAPVSFVNSVSDWDDDVIIAEDSAPPSYPPPVLPLQQDKYVFSESGAPGPPRPPGQSSPATPGSLSGNHSPSRSSRQTAAPELPMPASFEPQATAGPSHRIDYVDLIDFQQVVQLPHQRPSPPSESSPPSSSSLPFSSSSPFLACSDSRPPTAPNLVSGATGSTVAVTCIASSAFTRSAATYCNPFISSSSIVSPENWSETNPFVDSFHKPPFANLAAVHDSTKPNWNSVEFAIDSGDRIKDPLILFGDTKEAFCNLLFNNDDEYGVPHIIPASAAEDNMPKITGLDATNSRGSAPTIDSIPLSDFKGQMWSSLPDSSLMSSTVSRKISPPPTKSLGSQQAQSRPRPRPRAAGGSADGLPSAAATDATATATMTTTAPTSSCSPGLFEHPSYTPHSGYPVNPAYSVSNEPLNSL